MAVPVLNWVKIRRAQARFCWSTRQILALARRNRWSRLRGSWEFNCVYCKSAPTFFNNHTEQLAELALLHRLPAIYEYHRFAAAGGLASYGGDITEAYRLAGVYAARILKGEKPSDLPVQQSTKVQLIINLKTAKVLGITVPIPVLGRADEVIEIAGILLHRICPLLAQSGHSNALN
jgi:ABC transporter substrate binding protein